jgi:hypothetical protein
MIVIVYNLVQVFFKFNFKNLINFTKENTFETAYSAASWPAKNFNIGQDDCVLVLGENNFTMDSCIEFFFLIN